MSMDIAPKSSPKGINAELTAGKTTVIVKRLMGGVHIYVNA